MLLKIKDIMTDNVATVSPETTVVEAARLMQQHDIGSSGVRRAGAGGDRYRPGHRGSERGPW
jgi:CBS domain-containing protein